MEFRVLGPVEVVESGRRLELGGSRPRALLAVLLLHANEVVSVDRLVDELWGAEPPVSVANTLQQTVSRLRRVLGPDRIETRSPGYLLRVEPGEFDLERFEELVAAGDAGGLREGLALWRGEPLADFAYERFAQGAIARLSELRLAALERRIEADLAQGSPAGLVAEIDALVVQQPLRERLRALQLVALYRAGRQADALAAYQDARRLLGDELGLDPSLELQRLEKQILTHDPALDPPAAQAAAAAAAVEQQPAGTMPPPVVPAEVLVEALKLVTVLFCDVVSGGGSADGLDPEALRAAQARSSELVAAAVERHGGMLESSAGGELMAVFGVPAVHEDDALRALRAAVEIRDALPALGLAARIGVQSGEVITGSLVPVAGVAVAVAKRLADAAAEGEVLIGAPTLALTARAADVEQSQPLQLRGSAAPLPAFRVVRVRELPEREHGMRFVGRERELALIGEAFQRVVAGPSCELVTVVGDAGIGKSRLVAEALAPLAALILRGRCLPYGEGITYWPLVEVLGQLHVAPPGEAAAPIRALLGETQATTTAGEIAWAFRKTLEHAAAEQPLIVVFDDIQWGEEAFLGLVEQTALLAAGAPILLLCISRPELLERRAGWPGQNRLEPLPDIAVDKLIPRRIADPLREKIAQAANGNPLFVEELLAFAGDANDELVVPPTLQAVLAARLDQLDPDERAVLTCGAVEGETFHHGAVQALATTETQLAARLAALVRKGLIRPDRPDLPGEDGYRFRHILIRGAAYATLPKTRRSDLHASHAHWLETQKPGWAEDHADILAYHYTTALELATETGAGKAKELEAPALRFLLLAGERALRVDASAALSSFERALTLTPPGHPDRPHVLTGYGEATHQAARTTAAAEALEEAVAAFRAAGDLPAAARAAVTLSEVYVHSRDPRRAELLAELLALLKPLPPGPELIAVLTETGHDEFLNGRYEAGLAYVERALALADQLGLDRPVRTLGFRATIRSILGDPGALDDFRAAMALARAAGQGRHLLGLYNNFAVALGNFEGPAAALEANRAGIAFAQARGITGELNWQLRSSVRNLLELGELDQALETLAVVAERAENAWQLAVTRMYEARILILRGQADRIAAGTLDWLESQAGETSHAISKIMFLDTAATVRAALGQHDAAAALLTRLAALPGRHRWSSDVIRTALGLGELELAERLIGSADEFPDGTPRNANRLTTARAALAEARGEYQAAAAGYAEAAEGWQRLGVVTEQAFARLGQGRCLIALGRPAEATDALRQARVIFDKLQAAPALAETDALLQQTAALSS